MTRYAYIPRVGADDLERVRRYMPANYTANVAGTFSPGILITGRDEAGWTLDGYVIPRLASGLIFAREIDADERDALLDQARDADLIERDNLRGICAPDY